MTEKITFPNAEGVSLSARLEMPINGRARAYAVMAHCFTCSKNLHAAQHISHALTQKGIAVLRFDFTGLGESEGEFEDTNFSSNVEDLVAAAAFLEEHYEAPQLLVGHSLGGAAVLLASLRIDSITAVVTLAAPAQPAHLQKIFTDDLDTIEQEGEAKVTLGGRTFTITRQLLRDLREAHEKHDFTRIKCSLLILHSPTDTVVGIENAAEIYQQAHHPKSFIALDNADHLLTKAIDSQYAGDMIATWAQRYLTFSNTELTTDKQVVTSTGPGFTTEIMAEQHVLIADEPASVGGDNLGPSPYDLLVASLGACTGMTLRMYADRKKWPLKEVRVHLQHKKDYDQDCQSCEEKEEKIDHIERSLEIIGDLDEEQRKRLLEIADRCPVHKTLEGDIKVTTSYRNNS